MKPATSLVALLSLASLAVSSATPSQGILSSCNARDRVLVETRNVTAAGHEIQISTKACSADVLTTRSLKESLTFNACTGGPGPLESDCASLESALPAAVAAASGDSLPSWPWMFPEFDYSGPTMFTVAPQFVQEFTLGTCLWAWINNNPINGATLQYCYVGVEVHGGNIDELCIIPGDTGGVAIPSNPQLNPVVLAWIFEFSSPFLNLFFLIDAGDDLGWFSTYLVLPKKKTISDDT
ncbi:hypothetical protein FB451DRAFT_1372370 [Mycena latifolia]|nr:hypothetical protein FB451DRAFT_1372370 [Mycena latifolia]